MRELEDVLEADKSKIMLVGEAEKVKGGLGVRQGVALNPISTVPVV